MAEKRLRVAALVDLPRSEKSGGHVKCWERLAEAAADSDLPLDLTVFCSGPARVEEIGPKARFRSLPPIFSTEKLRAILPYVPDHTDLSPFHPGLARALREFDLIHTTDGYFAFARTAERVSRRLGLPLTTSFHTDTPAYARVFTTAMLQKFFGTSGFLLKQMIETLRLPAKQENKMRRRLEAHVSVCRAAIITREEDRALAKRFLPTDRVSVLRLGVDRQIFNPGFRDREGVEATYGVEKDRIILLFVGRLDVGKNIYILIEALEALLKEGLPLHLITAGLGPAEQDLRARLGDAVTVSGFVKPEELGRLYASVDALVVPSEVEIRGMIGGEALAAGCPVLVSEKSGVAELFNHTPGMRVVPGTAAAWADAIRSFAQNPEERHHRRETALAYGQNFVPGWREILEEDLFRVWQKAAG